MVAASPHVPPPRAPRYRRRAKTLKRAELQKQRVRRAPVDEALFADRPQTRGDCAHGPRPCPWVACKYHLYLDVNPKTGSIKLNYPQVAPDQLDRLAETCALDVADHGGITLEEVGERLQVSRERIRQVEVRGLLALKLASPATRRRRPIGGAERIASMTQLYELRRGPTSKDGADA